MTTALSTRSQVTTSVRADRMQEVWRAFGAAGVFLSAVVHLDLYFDQGFKDIKIIGPAFMLNAIAGLVIGFALLLWRHWIPAFLTFGFGVATLAAYYLSATVGLFNVKETWGGAAVILAEVAEWIAVLAGLVLLLSAVRARKSMTR